MCMADSGTLRMAALTDEDLHGVLLYYKYVNLQGQAQGDVTAWIEAGCKQLNLRGRIRVAEDGINVCVAGTMDALQQHMDMVIAHPVLRGADIDFKLSTWEGPRSHQVQVETGFGGLAVKQCKELVTLGVAEGRADHVANTGVHLSPQEWHAMLAAAAGGTGCGAPGASEPKDTVLVDARNIYETCIGHFQAGGAVPLLDPCTRVFSELPAWLDAHASQLAHKRVMMYCTGGVRCERATAYLREKGPEFSDVYQLKGGIQRYLEAFPDGGFFHGKNFVYDDRISMGPQAPGGCSTTSINIDTSSTQAHTDNSSSSGACSVVGTCVVCGRLWDDYGARARCSHCRMLLLVCNKCAPCTAPAAARAATADDTPGVPAAITSLKLLCPLCQERRARGLNAAHAPAACCACTGHASKDANSTVAAASTTAATAAGHSSSHTPPSTPLCGQPATIPATGEGMAAGGQQTTGSSSRQQTRKLRILCLHGFRQTASGFEGRTHALRKKMRGLADFVFVDASHTLPFFLKQQQHTADASAVAPTKPDSGEAQEGEQPVAGQGQGMPGSSSSHVAEADGWGLAQGQEEIKAGQAPVRTQVQDQARGCKQGGRARTPLPAVPPAGARKRAWLLSPQLMEHQAARRAAASGPLSAEAAVVSSAMSPQVGTNNGGADACSGEAAVIAAGASEACVWEVAPDWVDAQQHLGQTEGWGESWAVLSRVLTEQGPFDGVLGFSQGAGIVAALCALWQLQQKEASHPLLPAPCPGLASLRFAILASGYLPAAPELAELVADAGPLTLPSLHMFGGEAGGDRQIGPAESEALARCFAFDTRVCMRHGAAHILPATRRHADALAVFLEPFLAVTP